MFRKPIFLYIATFILAVGLAFFSSYFVIQDFLIQKVIGKDVGVGNDINMNNYKITDIGFSGLLAGEAIPFSWLKQGNQICLPRNEADTCFTNTYCIDSWCDINDFNFCPPSQDAFYPYGEPPPACFTADTPILMADGSHKNIADVQVGEYVLTRESDDSPKLVKAKVLEVYEHWVNGYLIINDELEVTRSHRMFVNGEWKTAGKIKLGDKLLNGDNQEIAVESIEERIKEEKFKVYNLEIENYKTYFANGFYVHNRKPDPEL